MKESSPETPIPATPDPEPGAASGVRIGVGAARRGASAGHLGLVLLLVLGILLALSTRPVWTLDPDAAAYLTLGRALAAGQGYVLPTGPDDAEALPHAKYPPGWPLMLAAVARVAGPEAYRAFHLLAVALLLGAVVLAWRLVRRLGYPAAVAFGVAGAVGLAQIFFDLSVVYLRTEVPFLLLGLAALLVLLRPRPTLGTLLLGAALVAAATMVRLAGVALLAVPALRLLWPRPADQAGPPGGQRLRAAALVVLALLPLAAWQLRAASIQAAHPEAADYGAEFWAPEPRDLTKTVRLDMPAMDASAWARRIGGNLEVLARACAVLLTNVDRAAHRLPVGALLLAVVALGLLALWRAGGARREAVAFLAASLGLYLIWPFNQQERFYAPLLPLLLLAAGEGLVCALQLVQVAARRRALRTAVLAGGLVVLAVLAAQRSDHPRWLGRWSTAYAALLVAGAAGWVALWAWTRRPRALPSPRLALALPLLFLPPFLARALHEWPAQVAAFEQRRAAEPRPAPLDRIEVHPLLEEAALFLTESTPPDAVVMTDVPKMLAILSGRRCVPFTYRVDPPQVVSGEARYVFYTGEIPEVAALVEARIAARPERFAVAHELRDADGRLAGRILAVR